MCIHIYAYIYIYVFINIHLYIYLHKVNVCRGSLVSSGVSLTS